MTAQKGLGTGCFKATGDRLFGRLSYESQAILG